MLWSGQESVTDGQTNGQTEAIPIIPFRIGGHNFMKTNGMSYELLCQGHQRSAKDAYP
jgi:hypothetical protein